ncbi:MAG: scytonemin biosynthesis cyclase/decarboxylase ScyC [Acetobacteraceae bacterium]|nr:scytonemin biosynthesis cyclase/decarboxylase ScyC [Acetobacteraceae bacterium]
MESNTFATSTYIATTEAAAFAYLRDLRNLDEWTLYSRMVEQMDEDTWRGTASGYQRDLYYHVRPIETTLFRGVEWHCGFEYGKYFQCYPALLFPASYVGSDEPGVYFHWLSFVGPARRTPMIMQGIHFVHTAEIRSLKAALERKAGHDAAVPGRFAIETASIYVDAPLETAAGYLGDLRNLAEWAYFIRPDGETGRERGAFRDEYGQPVEVSLRAHDCKNYVILEFEHRYQRLDYVQRNCLMLVPCSYAFGDPGARGCVQHRVAFFDKKAPPRHGKLQIEDYGAEAMSLKRRLEQRAGNLASFARGMSYLPEDAG